MPKHKLHQERVRLEAYMVHFDCVDNVVNFEVYPVQDWKIGELKGLFYISKNKDAHLQEFKQEDALVKMAGTYVWSGGWYNKIRFTDSEYLGYELGDLSQLFTDHISVWCEQYLSLNKPTHIH